MTRTLLVVLAMLPLAAQLRVDTRLDGGSAGRVEVLGPTHLRVAVAGQSDQDGRNRQANWYFFRIRGARPGAELTIDLVNLPGEYNYKPNRGAVTADTPGVWSEDGRDWGHISVFEYDKAEPRMRLRVTPRGRTVWIAHTPPYTARHLAALRRDAARARDFREEVIGRSVEGRPIVLWTFGAGPRAFWLMVRQHAWETGTSWVGEGFVRELLADEELRAAATWKVLPLCDPDGVFHGGVRFNRHGYDLNRNWDSPDSPRMPEIAAQRRAIRAWIEKGGKIDLFLTLHNTETGEYLEGAPGPLGPRLLELLQRRAGFAPSQPYRVSPPTTTAGMRGRMTVVQGLHNDFGIPAFLMEQRISRHPRLGRQPAIADRQAFGRTLPHVIRDSHPFSLIP